MKFKKELKKCIKILDFTKWSDKNDWDKNYNTLVYLPVKITGSNIVVFCMLTLYFR